MRESLIFSREFKHEDILKLLQSEGRINYLSNPDEFGEEITDGEKINLEKFSDLTDEFNRIIIQKDLELLCNNIQNILDYYYLREIVLNKYISDKYKDDNDKYNFLNRLFSRAVIVGSELTPANIDASIVGVSLPTSVQVPST